MEILGKAKEMVSKNADKINTAIDKTGGFVDSKTRGKFSGTVGTVQNAAKKAVGKAGQQS